MATATKKNASKKSTPATTKGSKAELERHPLSEKYGPKLDDEELQGLAADITVHGQHEPIIKYEGKVLAGWNRYKACLLAGKEPKTRDMDADSNPVAVAFGTNFVRRKLSSVQKAFYGAQFAIDSGEKQTDIAKLMACSLNRLNQCCQLLKRDDNDAKKAVERLRDNPEMGSAQFDELMLEVGVAREPTKRSNPARAGAGGPLDDDDDPLGGDGLLPDDLTGGEIDNLLDTDDDALNGDDASPPPARGKKKGSKVGEEVGDEEPLPAVGAKRSSTSGSFETPVSRVSNAFRKLSPAEQRSFVKFAWKSLKAALDAAIGGADVEYTPPEVIKADPSRIARNKPAETLDDGHKVKAKDKNKGKEKAPPAKPGKGKKQPTPAPAKKSKGKASKHDQDI